MTPVGNTIQVPNAVNAFANVVSLKQGIAQANQATQQNEELTALHQFTQQAMNDPSYRDDKGNLNIQKFQADASKVAPVYGQQYIGQMTANANEGIANKNAILNLTSNQRKIAGGFFEAIAEKPDATRQDFVDATTKAEDAIGDDAFSRSLKNMLIHVPVPNQNPAIDSQNLRQFARAVANGMGSDVSGSQTPTAFVQTTTGQQPVSTSPNSPFGAGTPIGEPVPGTNPQQLAFLQGQTGGISERANAGKIAANASPVAIDALNRIKDILDKGTWTGTAFSGFAQLKNLAASIGIDTTNATNASELMKNIARYESTRGNAVGNTDASRELFNASGPNYKMDSQAVKDVTDQALANEYYILGYGKLMSSSRDPNILMNKENQYRNVPNLIPALEAGQMKDHDSMMQFLKRYNLSPDDIAKSRKQLKDMGAL